MRVNTVKAAVIVMVLSVGWGSYALADTAVTVNTQYGGTGFDIYKYPQDQVSLGWRFFVDKKITITHLGLLDLEGNGLTSTHTMGLWRLPNKGGFGAGPVCTVSIGPGAVQGGDHHVYVALNPPITLDPNTNGYTLSNGTVNYERWLLGVWSPAGNQDKLVVYPLGAVTANGTDCWHIQEISGLKSYTYNTRDLSGSNTGSPYSTPSMVPPWGGTDSFRHWAMNFKYTMPGPIAEAGDPCSIYTSEQALTVIDGTATHTLGATSMQYQWFEGSTWLGSGAVGSNGAAPLNLGSVPALSIGPHTLRLEVTDGVYTSTDTMQLTVANSPPEGQPTPTSQTLEIAVDAIVITASVADFDGDAVNYQWVKNGEVLGSGTVTPPTGGASVEIADLAIPAGDPRFTLGSNQVQLVVNDGVNPAATVTVAVVLQDTTAPTVAPTSSINMLWPPNRELIPIMIWANGADNGGGVVVLTASVQCSENDGLAEPDSIIDAVDNTAGTIALRLRAERAGNGDGRVYTVTVTATDSSANRSVATVDIRVPHDKRKK